MWQKFTSLRWIVRDLKNQRNTNLFLILNFSLGLVGFLTLDSFKNSLDEAIQLNSKNFLSADFSVSTRRLFQAQEIEKIESALPRPFERGKLWEFFSMIQGSEGARLVSVKAVDPSYPFFGDLKLGSGRIFGNGSGNILADKNIAWVYPELLLQLGLKRGDVIKIGSLDFVIDDTVTEDSTQTFRLASLAPRIYVGINHLAKSELITKGSTLSEAFLYRLPKNAYDQPFVTTISDRLNDSSIQITTPKDAGEETARVLGYLSDYLGLVSLVALFLAIVGTAFLIRSSIAQRLKSIAILNALGLQRRRAQWIYLAEFAALGAVASLLSLGFSLVVLPLLSQLLQEFFPIHVELELPVKTICLALFMGIAGGLLIGWPLLRPFGRIKTQQLFQEESHFQYPLIWQDIFFWFPSLFCFWLLSIWQANSVGTGSLFFAGFAAAIILLGFAGWSVSKLFKSVKIFSHWTGKQAQLLIARKAWASTASLMALGLGALLINLIPQLRSSLQEEIMAPKDIKLPSLFIFDIQPEQVDGVQKTVKAQNLELLGLSAMVRARLITVNGKNFERGQNSGNFKNRDEEAENRSRNRGYNLSYREKLSASEQLVAGKNFSGTFDPAKGVLPEISLEVGFAQRIKVKMGDIMGFDVQGVEIKGQVTSLRSVQWNSFQPNFFIVFQPGVLEAAPATFLGSLPALPPDQLVELQRRLVVEFPNISIVDVGRVVKRIFDISEKMSWSLQLMAFLSLLAGLVVLYSMVTQQVTTRRWDLNLFKILGGHTQEVQRLILIEFGSLAVIGSGLGILISIGLSWAFSYFLFGGNFRFDVLTPVFVLVGVVGMALLIAWLGSYRVCREKPSTILQSGGI